ncbi:hypothetical protein GUJ93_ZPchr0012g22077 [Zizania palustris]|uniref:Uncharacterized protein n=1 Tax=Zizania palustris TaxID=103762 RepID=A0A8J5WS84_ZIZPA|nr:hypothetical protein GUJ93_ZPchr0012g22077 [Zizania palustris]
MDRFGGARRDVDRPSIWDGGEGHGAGGGSRGALAAASFGGSVNSRIEEIHGEVMVAVGLAMGPFGGVVAVVGEEGVVSHMLGGVPQVVDGETDIWSRILPEMRIRRFVS